MISKIRKLRRLDKIIKAREASIKCLDKAIDSQLGEINANNIKTKKIEFVREALMARIKVDGHLNVISFTYDLIASVDAIYGKGPEA